MSSQTIKPTSTFGLDARISSQWDHAIHRYDQKVTTGDKLSELPPVLRDFLFTNPNLRLVSCPTAHSLTLGTPMCSEDINNSIYSRGLL